MPTTLIDTTSATVLHYKIIGTDTTIVEAWEPFAGHTAMRHDDDDVWLGLITARPLPVELEALPGGCPERMSGAIDFHAANVLAAYWAISEAFPHLLDRDDIEANGGRVTLQGDPSLVPCTGGCGELTEPNWLSGIAWCGESGR